MTFRFGAPVLCCFVLLGCGCATATPAHLMPRWEPTYAMRSSTIVQPCNFSGGMDSVWLAKWGIVDMDWSNARGEWANEKPMNCDGKLLEQAKGIKQASKNATKVFVYRNIVKAA